MNRTYLLLFSVNRRTSPHCHDTGNRPTSRRVWLTLTMLAGPPRNTLDRARFGGLEGGLLESDPARYAGAGCAWLGGPSAVRRAYLWGHVNHEGHAGVPPGGWTNDLAPLAPSLIAALHARTI
jgi:hypothetical protein